MNERDEVAMTAWVCSCGWINGCNLSVCAMCGRTPHEGCARPFSIIPSDQNAAPQVVSKSASLATPQPSAREVAKKCAEICEVRAQICDQIANRGDEAASYDARLARSGAAAIRAYAATLPQSDIGARMHEETFEEWFQQAHPPHSFPRDQRMISFFIAIVRGERAAWAKGVGDDSAIMACDSILDSLLPMLAASQPPAEREKEGQ